MELTVVSTFGWNAMIGGLIVTPNGRIVLNLREAYDYVRSLPQSDARDEAARSIGRGHASSEEARKACVDAIYGRRATQFRREEHDINSAWSRKP
jgi:hypothetical protein